MQCDAARTVPTLRGFALKPRGDFLHNQVDAVRRDLS